MANVVGVYLVQISSLLLGQQSLGHFFRYRPLLPIGWRILQILSHHRRKITNTEPTTLSAIQAASQSTFTLHNYTPVVISRNDKSKQLTLLSQRKLALTARNTFCVKKIKKWPRPLFMPKTNHTCHQNPNPSRKTVPLNIRTDADTGTRQKKGKYCIQGCRR